MGDKKLDVMVWLTEIGGKVTVNFKPEMVTVTQMSSKINYLLDKEKSLGYSFAGAVFPIANQNPPSILDDVTSFKVKEGGYRLTIKDSNINAGIIGVKLLLVNAEGNIVESSDPQVKNDPTF
ncbi:DP-EP family protein [Shewanella waksmanii]|uniref:DP-EP family protein n=1 Tax=Shewanella waksmanii TaxID=213783 RepID=UPI0037356E97